MKKEAPGTKKEKNFDMMSLSLLYLQSHVAADGEELHNRKKKWEN